MNPERRPSSFGAVAPYYDELMSQVPYNMWVGYYLLLLSQQGVRPKHILDICCGTGTMTAMMRDEGFRMAGFDLSPAMIEIARQKNPDIRFEVMDAAEARMGETFEAAYSFFDSLNNITDPERLQDAFHRVYEQLQPHGSFIFDMNTAYAFEQRMFDQRYMKKGAKLRYNWVGDWKPDSKLISVDMTFWYDRREFHEVHVQRAYEQDEIRQMLYDAGFQEIRAFHSYTLGPPRYASDRIHWTALKP